jgi:hypothetical protein
MLKIISACNSELVVGLQVLTAASMKMAAFWVVAPCSLVERFETFMAHELYKILSGDQLCQCRVIK